MINLAGNKKADETILEELYLANIPAINVEPSKGEVPYSYIGRIGNWTFKRAWYYWIVSVERDDFGLPLNVAMELHNKKHPTCDFNLGKVIRSDGHCGCPSPDVFGAHPIHNEELNAKLEALGYKKEYCDFLKQSFISINVGEMSRLCNEGKLIVDRFVNCYHIDDQIGLVEFAKVVSGLVNSAPKREELL